MALNFKVEPQTTYLLMTYEGRYEPSLADQITSQVIEACVKNQLPKVLVDIRKVEGQMSTMDRYNLATLAAKKYLDEKLAGKIQSTRFAWVENHPMVDPKKFGETVATNRGLNIKVFTEVKEALAWLEVEPAGE
jgi:hypothetical protein